MDHSKLTAELHTVIKSYCPDYDERAVVRFVTNIMLTGHQNKANTLLDQHMKRMLNFVGPDVSTFANNLFVEAYTDIWPYLFKTADSDSCLPNGKITGMYFEEMIKAFVRGAITPTATDVTVGSNHPTTDVLITIPSKNKTASLECKGQSDKTSFRNALDHIKENYASHSLVGAVFRTSAFFPKDKQVTHLHQTLAALPGSNQTLASTFVHQVYAKSCGVFQLTPKIVICVLGTPTDKYKKWNGENYTNHGGPKAWEQSPVAITEFVDFWTNWADN